MRQGGVTVGPQGRRRHPVMPSRVLLIAMIIVCGMMMLFMISDSLMRSLWSPPSIITATDVEEMFSTSTIVQRKKVDTSQTTSFEEPLLSSSSTALASKEEDITAWIQSYIDFQNKWVVVQKEKEENKMPKRPKLADEKPFTQYTLLETSSPNEKNNNKNEKIEPYTHQQEQQRQRPPLLVWNCPWRGSCGGLGDRLYGIIMGLYVAMLSHRLYFVQEWSIIAGVDRNDDDNSVIRHALFDYLEPNHLQSYQWTYMAHQLSSMDKIGELTTVDNRDHPLLVDPCQLENDQRDYFFRNNLMTYESQLVNSTCMQDYWQQFGDRSDDGDGDGDNRPLSHLGFWTLFRFSRRVEEQAQHILRQAQIWKDSSSSPTRSRIIDDGATGAATSAATEMYIAMHIRTGQGETWDDPERHSGVDNFNRFDQCALRMQNAIKERCNMVKPPSVYIAADNSEVKAFLLDRHSHGGSASSSSFKAIVDMEVFHIERTKPGSLKNVRQAYDLVWGELKVLVDATCLVMSHSKFSTLAHDLSKQQPRCAVYFDECNDEHIQQAVQALACPG